MGSSIMRAHVLEYFLKGIFLGLAIYGALQSGISENPPITTFLTLNGIAWGGLLFAFIAGTSYGEGKNATTLSSNC